MQQVLNGIRVLDLGQGIAGPAAAKFFGDFGAEVIKVEPLAGDCARMRGPFPGDVPDPEQSALFANYNRNKLGVALDVFTPRGRVLLDRLIAESDILISSFSPREFEELRLDYETVKAVNPAIVVVAITPWGLTGPYRDYRISEIGLDAFGHSMCAFGTRDREPLTLGGGLRQHYAGRIAAAAAIAAQRTAEQSGTGQLIDVSMIEALLSSADRRSTHLLRYQYNHRLFPRVIAGSAAGNMRGGFQICGDGWLHVSLNPRDIAALAPILGRADWLDDSRYQPMDEVFRTTDFQNELAASFLEWSLGHTRHEINLIARANRLPIYPVNHFGDLIDDAHLKEREFWVEETHPVTGTNTYPGAPFKLARDGYAQRRPAPLLGQHNVEVFCDRIGLSRAELDDLVTAGIVTSSSAARALVTAATPVEAPLPRPARRAPSTPDLPLRGLRVLDMTASWAGPSTTMMLGDLGAEIVRVESIQFFPVVTRGGVVRPKDREEMESFPNQLYNGYVDFEPGERPWNRYATFNVMARNKMSMTADLRRSEGIEIFKKLVAMSDIVVDNYAFGVMEKLGLGDSVLRAVNPRLINISMPLYGNFGPNRAVSGMGSVVDSWSGFLTMRGYRDFDVGASQVATHMDSATGPGALFALLCALRDRDRTNVGQFIDFSQSENMLQAVGDYFLDSQWNHREAHALGNRDRWGGIQGCYRCAGEDKWVVLTVRTDEDWRRLAQAFDHPEWAEDERYASPSLRLQHHDEIDALITERTSHLGPNEAMTRLQHAGIAAARVLDERDALEDPHIKARDYWIPTTQSESGTHLYPGHQWKAHGTPLRADTPAPLLGEHNEYVYKELLHYSDAEYERLEREQHIGVDYLPGLLPGRG